MVGCLDLIVVVAFSCYCLERSVQSSEIKRRTRRRRLLKLEISLILRYIMISHGLVSEQVFSFWLNCDSEGEDGGEIVFGGVNPKHFKGSHTHIPIIGKGYWQFEMGDILIGSHSTSVEIINFIRVIVNHSII